MTRHSRRATSSAEESLKYCTKFIKKDKEMEFVPDQLDFIEELRAETIAQADRKWTLRSTPGRRACTTTSPSWTRGPAAKMLGLANYYGKATRDATANWQAAIQLMGSMTGRIKASEEIEYYRDEPLTESMTNLLKTGIIRAEQLEADGKRTQAIELLESGLPLFEGDRSFMVTYGSIVG